MKSFIKLVVSITLLIALSHKAFAWESSVYFFKDRYGQEIPVKVSYSGDTLNYTFMVHYSLDPESTFYDFVSSTLRRENYRKKTLDEPCDECIVTDDESESKKFINVPETSKASPINTFIEGIADTLGTRWESKVFNTARNQPEGSSPLKFVILRNQDKRHPKAICSITIKGCDNVSRVTVNQLDDNRFTFSIDLFNEAEHIDKIHAIKAAIDNYRLAIGYGCKITYTGITDNTGNIMTHWTCGPSY